MNWDSILAFARGPMFYFALLIFVGGMFYRLVRIVLLGWKPDRVPARGSKLGGVVKTYAKNVLILPFIPWVKGTFSRNAIMYIAGGLFHLSLFTVIFLGTAHMLVWKSLLGFGWPTLALPIVDWLAAIGIVAMLVLFVNRLVNPVLKLITGPAEWLNWGLVFIPMLTGYMMTHHLFFPYQVLFSLHMIAVDLLLIWIPASRISHFMFYFFSRTIHGTEFGKRAVSP
jgi:nitrate reductase gamma subunit